MLEAIGNQTPPTARPFALILRVTERCEVGCDHCCINATPAGLDMDLEMLEACLEGAKANGVGLIHISGGEPLLNSQVEQFVKRSSGLGFFVELTTSTYSTEGQNDFERLAKMKAAGLKRVMLSYDASHAQRVSIEHFAEFVREALAQDLEVCVVVVDWEDSAWHLETVKSKCEAFGVNGTVVDWCRASLSAVGRAKRKYGELVAASGQGARCPYVLTAPTLAPDGTVFLCPNLQSKSRLYQLGNVNRQPMEEILDDLQSSSFYRSLSALGPHGAAQAMGLTCELPEDMCGCCQVVLKEAEAPEKYARLEAAVLPEAHVAVDIDALLPGHRRFVLNEPQSETGCFCG